MRPRLFPRPTSRGGPRPSLELATATLVLCAFLVGGLSLWPRPSPMSAVPTKASATASVWTPQLGGFHRLARLRVRAADHAWAVGSNAVRFDGRSWLARDRRDVDGSLRALDLLPDGSGWIVGDEEAIPVDGERLLPALSLPGIRLQDVVSLADGDAIAVGRDSRGGRDLILRYRDSRWQTEWTAPDPAVHLTALWMSSEQDGWAVGSTAVHYDGRSWTEWSLPMADRILRVTGTGPDRVWAFGGIHYPFEHPSFRDRRLIFRWDGAGWHVERDEEAPGIQAVAMQGDRGYAIDMKGEVLELRGERWEETGLRVPTGDRPTNLVQDVDFLPDASSALVVTGHGWVYRLDDEGITLVRDAGILRAIGMRGESQGWALGRRAYGYDGLRWEPLPSGHPLQAARDLAVSDAGVAWAVGDAGLVMREQDGAWERLVDAPDVSFSRVRADEEGAVWALGELRPPEVAEVESRLYRYERALGWQERWRGVGAPRDLSVAEDVHLIATDMGLWRGGEGRSWTRLRDDAVDSVGLGAGGELWAGGQGWIERYDEPGDGIASEWRTAAWLPNGARVHAIARVGDVSWAVADQGYVLAHEGERWRILRGTSHASGTAGQEFGLHAIGFAHIEKGQGIWVAGEPDTILHARAGDVLALPEVLPEPTSEWPNPLDRQHRAYLPIAVNRPAWRSARCHDAPSLSVEGVEGAAIDWARAAALPEAAASPSLRSLRMLSVDELRDQAAVDLDGVRIGAQRLGRDTCLWWAELRGWFDATAAGSETPTPAATTEAWRRLQLVLLAEDGRVAFEAFHDPAPRPTAQPTAAPPPTPPPLP